MLSLAVQARVLLGQASSRWTRALYSTPNAWFPDVVVPPLGESVSEGTISTILKQAGDQVQVDETIAQLETDKVTIDCKSQFAGTVTEVLVKPGDVVQPGHRLVVVGEGSGAAASAPSAAPAAPQPAAAAAPSSSHGRVPAIKFPPRTTPDGQRISALPAAEADAVLAKLTGVAAPKPAPKPAATPAARPAAAAAASKPAGVAGPPRSKDTTYIQDRPARRTLTEREMDMINMGGVWP